MTYTTDFASRIPSMPEQERILGDRHATKSADKPKLDRARNGWLSVEGRRALGSPYRTVGQTSRVIRGQVPMTAYLWTAWSAVAAIAAIVGLGRSSHSIAVLTAGVLLVSIGTIATVRSLEKRVKWRLALEGERFRIERIAGRTHELVGEVDVRGGVRLNLGFETNPLSIDVSLAVASPDERFIWDSGMRVAVAGAHVVRFLRDNGIPVNELSDTRLGWQPH